MPQSWLQTIGITKDYMTVVRWKFAPISDVYRCVDKK